MNDSPRFLIDNRDGEPVVWDAAQPGALDLSLLELAEIANAIHARLLELEARQPAEEV